MSSTRNCHVGSIVMVAVTVLGFAGVAQAIPTVVIDDFENADPTLWPLVANSGDTFDPNSQSGVAGVVGGTRVGEVGWASGPGSITADISGGVYSAMVDAGTSPDDLGLSYSAGGAGLGLDLSSDDSIIIDVASASPSGVRVNLTLEDIAINRAAINLTATGPGVLSFPLAGFTGVDLTNIRSISVTMNPEGGENTAFNEIFVDNGVVANAAVPEPLTVTLGLMGLGVLGMATRRRSAYPFKYMNHTLGETP